ncbi:MAG TPA: glycine cleavage T C-terminal barrel domain-containing protein [Aggregatilinea sp.]|uniref:CAF17-like 4Fe-4S cluster assembly/insertion protein YgfZ n=1 Tax=Aggregatilinea sp. TaxID=2806333 RepID=UPI002C7FB52E|nr:glycine cleavage T C-terminal barrel domain-containing protein [Aggregatilinea sp.]HML21715.1 glycine cleavage T C-terminal barrel domain-containing protein [Aggregatilinea sp.]
MQTAQQQLAGYDAAHRGAAFRRVPEPGIVVVRGQDPQGFIQRQTTNDARMLAPDRSVVTVLTSGTARILDVWRLVPEPDGTGILTLPGRGALTARYLQGRIFFMDKVTVSDDSAAWAQIELIGPETARVLAAFGLAQAPAPDQILTAALGDVSLRIVGQDGSTGQGCLLLVPAAHAEAAITALAQNGAVEMAPDAYAVFRVEQGLPGPDHELTESYTPLEVRLDGTVSLDKGCYTGQEVLARQVNYDKITRRLAGLRLDAEVPVGAAVLADERTVGEVTSIAHSPRLGWLALAVIKRPHFEPGVAVAVRAEGGDIPTVTSALPFPTE